MKYDYENMSPEQFEKLVFLVCQEILGLSTQNFSKGRDGGIDAMFEGTANLIPSKNAPWKGKVIIQAKHTNAMNASFSENDFFNNCESNNTILSKEIPKIIRLIDNKELDHYMLFSNRKLTAQRHQEMRNYVSKKCGLPTESIIFCGINEIENYLERFHEIAKIAKIDPIDYPLYLKADDLEEIIESLSANLLLIERNATDNAIIERTNYERKKEINGMTDDYAKQLEKTYSVYIKDIFDFLSHPNNESLLKKYEAIIEEYQLKIIAHRQEYQSFDKLMNYIFDKLIAQSNVLRQTNNKRLTRAMLFYMFWNCDIGQSDA
jgi:hypothetical protein